MAIFKLFKESRVKTIRNTRDGIKVVIITIMELIIILSIVLLVLILAVRLTVFSAEIKSELKYLNSEIERTKGKERKYYKKYRRRLFWSFLPFVKYK